jgi:putative oxygen-independent coproporphyrinogen III oxidase
MQAPLAIYIHWPFCLSKCPYCDFNSHVTDAIDQARWRHALLQEIEHFSDQTKDRPITSIFFGGGTPSLMDPETTACIIEHIKTLWPVEDGVEITLEANPTSSEAARFSAFRAAGVNRLSLGVQALNDDALAFLERRHSAAEALKALEAAAGIFPVYSFDLIYAFSGEALGAWRKELALAASLARDHISLYQLTIAPETPFGRDNVSPAPEEDAAALFSATEDVLSKAGFPSYEVSNHAHADRKCRHNLHCWKGGDYLGIGPGAHGRISDGVSKALNQIRAPERWLKAVEATGHGTQNLTPLSPRQRSDEIILTGLRLTDGIERQAFYALFGQTIEEALNKDALSDLIDGGFLELDRERLKATPEGRLRLNAVIGALLS